LAFGDTSGENARLLLRTLRGVADFDGRSQRTEVVYYWIACMLVGVVINFSAIFVIPSAAFWLDSVLQLLFVIPLFALFVRRVHDQDRSGRWGLLLPLTVLMGVPRSLALARGDAEAIIANTGSPLAIASGLVVLAILILCLLPGTDGPNRYGPDPRLEDA